MALRYSRTSETLTSGVDAPEVTPMELTPLSQPASISATSAIRYEVTP